MASIRRRNGKYQVQVRIGKYSASKSFLLRSDAKEWARNQEIEASAPLFLGCHSLAISGNSVSKLQSGVALIP